MDFKTDSLVNSGFLLMIIGTLLRIIYANYLKAIGLFLNYVSYRVSFTSKIPVYYEFLELFNKHSKTKNLTLLLNNSFDRGCSTQSKDILGPGYGFHFFFYDKIFILVYLFQEKEKLESFDRVNLRIFSRDETFLNLFLKDLTSYSQLNSDKLLFYSFCNGSSWKKNDNIYKRTLSSVVLDKVLKDSITQSIDSFIASKEIHNKLNIPHKRGYLLYGPPGTGKTTLVKALASELNLPIYSISLENLSSYGFGELLSYLKPNSILLLEDIDRMQFDDKENISLRQLLNIIDGIETPEDILIFMTANNPEKLDKALIRTGRIDLKINLDYVDKTQIKSLLDLLLLHKYDIDFLVIELLNFMSLYNLKLVSSDIQQFALLYNKDPKTAFIQFETSILNERQINNQSISEKSSV